MVWGFKLSESEAFELLDTYFNPRCVPEWSESELRRKCRDATDGSKFDKPYGWLLDAESPPRNGRVSPTATAGTSPTPRQVGQGEGIVAPSSPAAPSPPGRPNPPVAPPTLTTIRNYVIRTGDGGAEVHAGLTPQQITREVLRASGGWPKAMGGRLFVPNDDFTPNWLDESGCLFAWLAGHLGQSGGLVEWGRGTGQIPKAEFFIFLCSAVDQYEDVQTYPHHPPRPGTCYLHPSLPAGGSGKLDVLLTRLCPATPTDRVLMRTVFLTLAWGGSPGGRPMYIIEAANPDGKPGQGSGKSTAVMLAGELFGGYVGLSFSTDDLQVQNRLLSPIGRRARLVVFDNAKGTRMSNVLIESYVTAPTISGKEMWQGEGTRPNHLTWIITANQPSLSKDFVGRGYPLRVTPPEYSPEWLESIKAFIRDYRWEILGDIIAELKGEPIGVFAAGEWSRWAEWELQVLCRVCDPHTIAETVRMRRQELDDDDATTDTIQEAFALWMTTDRPSVFPRSAHFWFTTAEMAEALGKLCPNGASAIAVGRWLNAMNLPRIKKQRQNSQRMWVWKGEESMIDEPIAWGVIPD